MVADAVITAGSAPDCDIVLRVSDLDSQEGTFINQRRIDDGVVGARDLHGLVPAVLVARLHERGDLLPEGWQ
ncbi:MAG: hypothetical protein ABIS06_15980 [Vicinamibacterales bacterium]